MIQMWVEDYIRGKEKDVEFILSICQSFERQLDRNRFLSASHTSAYKRFVQYAKKLVNMIEKVDVTGERIAKLEEALSQESNLHGKSWLVQKLSSMRLGSN